MMKSRKVLTNSLVLAIFLLASGMIALAEGANFTGVWDTNFGTMTLKQNGNSVTGTYTHDDGRIEGKVSGGRLDFRWFEEPTYSLPNDAGGGYFIIAADGKSFKGKWRYGFSGPWRDGEWKGELMTMPVGSGSSPAPPSRGEKHPPGTRGGPMVFVPAGEFIMGDDDEDSHFTARPSRKVYLDEFFIDKYEVTNTEFNKCARSGPCWGSDVFRYKGFEGSTQPVIGISWYQAKDYCEWVGKRLPTEAEWEKAARGADGRLFPWGNKISCSMANYKRCGHDKTTPVGSYPAAASPYGALDMAGNVGEWTFDWSDEAYHKNTPDRNPVVTVSPENVLMNWRRVTRGGSWRAEFGYVVRSSYRSDWQPISRNDFIGFRCAK